MAFGNIVLKKAMITCTSPFPTMFSLHSNTKRVVEPHRITIHLQMLSFYTCMYVCIMGVSRGAAGVAFAAPILSVGTAWRTNKISWLVLLRFNTTLTTKVI